MNDSMKIRMNNNNILIADVDPATHALSGNIYDEETDQSYPVGGGGGSSITPILNLTLTSNSTPYGAKNVINNGNVLESSVITAGEIADILVIGNAVINNGNVPTLFFGYIVGNKSEQVTYEVTNLVNCTLVENEDIVGIQITDPSQNASATLHYDQT